MASVCSLVKPAAQHSAQHPGLAERTEGTVLRGLMKLNNVGADCPIAVKECPPPKTKVLPSSHALGFAAAQVTTQETSTVYY